MSRIKPLLVLALAAALTTACAATFRTVGQHDPTVEAIKALADVLKAQKLPPTPTPTPSPMPEGGR